jgi:hypothetical protein
MTAPLADGREMNAVADELQGELVRLTGPVATRNRENVKQRTVHAT